MRRTRYLKSQASSALQPYVRQHYTEIRLLGKGSFGTVRLAQGRFDSSQKLTTIDNGATLGQSTSTNVAKYLQQKLFAVKVICKSDMLALSQEGHLRAERDCLVAAKSGK